MTVQILAVLTVFGFEMPTFSQLPKNKSASTY